MYYRSFIMIKFLINMLVCIFLCAHIYILFWWSGDDILHPASNTILVVEMGRKGHFKKLFGSDVTVNIN